MSKGVASNPKSLPQCLLDLNHKAVEKVLRLGPCLLRTTLALRLAARNYSIPIEHGPAQFNAFYPQCSGTRFAASLRLFTAGALRIES